MLLGGAVVLQLVAAFLLIVVFGPKRQDSPPRCQANLRRIITSMALYAQDNDDRYPSAPSWMNAMVPYDRDSSAFRCPYLGYSDLFAFGYAFNSSLSQAPRSGLTNPSAMPVVYDSSRIRRNANDAVSSLPNPPRHRGRIDGITGMAWGNNVAFADGRVALTPLLPSRGGRQSRQTDSSVKSDH